MRPPGALGGPCRPPPTITPSPWCPSGGTMEDMRSKSRVLTKVPATPEELPAWNYDGSSTGQASHRGGGARPAGGEMGSGACGCVCILAVAHAACGLGGGRGWGPHRDAALGLGDALGTRQPPRHPPRLWGGLPRSAGGGQSTQSDRARRRRGGRPPPRARPTRRETTARSWGTSPTRTLLCKPVCIHTLLPPPPCTRTGAGRRL